MEFFFYLMIFGLIAIFLSKGKKTIKMTCDMKKEHHKWIYKEQDGNEYLVCSICKALPGGNEEQSHDDPY